MGNWHDLAQKGGSKGAFGGDGWNFNDPWGLEKIAIVYVDQPGKGGDRDTYEFNGLDVDVGHVFIEVKDTDKKETTGQVGKYPTKGVSPNEPETKGEIKDDTGHKWDVKKEYKLTDEQYKKIKDYIKKQKKNPDKYHLDKSNCTDFVIDVMKKGNIKLPDTKGSWPGGSGSNPGDLGEDLAKKGGTRNSKPSSGGGGSSKSGGSSDDSK
jgi:hypothetical protein